MSAPFTKEEAQKALQKYWNYSNFRAKQDEVINALSDGQDVIALLPTGGGKSICYQVPALLAKGLTVVVSPLISLMEDQVSALKSKGIKAEAIHSGHTYGNIDRILDNCIFGDIKLLYVSPERLQHDLFLARIKKLDIDLLAIDEAHCISQWGHDFRPSYMEIRHFIDEMKPRQVIALTATATDKVIEELKKLIFAKEPTVVKGSFVRDNIAIGVLESKDKLGTVLKYCQSSLKTIIYVRSRKKVEMIAQMLSNHKVKSAYFHAGLTYKEKKKIQKDFKENKLQIVAATNAFGMGIDISDIRQVIHYDIPPSIEEYYQEIGRAGRDGSTSKAVLLFSKQDLSYSERRQRDDFPEFEFAMKLYKSVHVFYNVGLGEGIGRSKPLKPSKLSKIIGVPLRPLLSGLKLWQKLGAWEVSYDSRPRIYCSISFSPKELRKEEHRRPKLYPILDYFMRHYEQLFDGWIQLDMEKDARAVHMSMSEYKTALDELSSHSVIKLYKLEPGQMLSFIQDRISNKYLAPYESKYERLKENARLRWLGVSKFLENTDCRMMNVLHYFDEKDVVPCGTCDNCRNNSNGTVIEDTAARQRAINEGTYVNKNHNPSKS